jgi:hypothetical protein
MSLTKDAKAELERIRPLVELLDHKGWLSLKARFEEDIEILSACSWRVGSQPSKQMLESLAMMGIPEPKTKEDMLDCFHQFRAVVNYVSNKLGYLERLKKRFEDLRITVVQEETKND